MVSLYLEGQGDLVSGLIMGITRVTIWVIGVHLTYLVSPPDPPSRAQFFCVRLGEGSNEPSRSRRQARRALDTF